MHNDTVERNFHMVEQVIHQLQTWKADTDAKVKKMESRIAILETDNRMMKQQAAAQVRW